jgi:hypothetical protein
MIDLDVSDLDTGVFEYSLSAAWTCVMVTIPMPLAIRKRPRPRASLQPANAAAKLTGITLATTTATLWRMTLFQFTVSLLLR